MRHLTTMTLTRIAVVVLLCTVSVSTAFAAQPTRSTSESTFEIPGFVQCSYGPLDGSFTATDYLILFYDQAGNLIRTQDHFVITTVLTNPLNGKSGSGTTVGNSTGVYEAGQQTGAIGTALGFRLIVDGRQLPIASGRAVVQFVPSFQITFQTPHAVFTEAIQTAVCDALQ